MVSGFAGFFCRTMHQPIVRFFLQEARVDLLVSAIQPGSQIECGRKPASPVPARRIGIACRQQFKVFSAANFCADTLGALERICI
jgi:hypothetical protein